jgi:hypothetical protein
MRHEPQSIVYLILTLTPPFLRIMGGEADEFLNSWVYETRQTKF